MSAYDTEEALKAVAAATKKRDACDDAGALRLVDKALRLDPQLKEAKALQEWLTKCVERPRSLGARTPAIPSSFPSMR